MPEPAELRRHLKGEDAFARLNTILEGVPGSIETERILSKLAAVTKPGHDRAVLNFLQSYAIVRMGARRVQVDATRWSLLFPIFRDAKSAAHNPPALALANLPADSELERPSNVISIQAAVELILAEPADAIFFLNPFFDASGIEEFRPLLSRLPHSTTKAFLVTRFTTKSSQHNDCLSLLLRSVPSAVNLTVINYHFQRPDARFHDLSFHAKGIYSPEAAVVATMNYVSANLARNVEFGVFLRGPAARGLFSIVKGMASSAPSFSASESLVELKKISSS